MSESYSVAPSSTGWLSKRVAGIPVVYLAGAVVAILVIVAYLGTKKNTTGATASTATTVPVDPYTTLNSTGTVTTSQPVYFVPQNTQNVDTPAVQNNADWQRAAVQYLVASGNTIGDAQGSIQAYITGKDMTYAESNLVNTAVAKNGMPPTITNIGTVAPKIDPIVASNDPVPITSVAPTPVAPTPVAPTPVAPTPVAPNYANGGSYTDMFRDPNTGAIFGTLSDGSIHHLTPNEWVGLNNSYTGYSRNPATGSIVGTLADGTVHHLSPGEYVTLSNYGSGPKY
jgi:hypothetical protein